MTTNKPERSDDDPAYRSVVAYLIEEIMPQYSAEKKEEATNNLIGYLSIVERISQRRRALREKLVQHPEGFAVEDDSTCIICLRTVAGSQTWYDKLGMKCLTCQKALRQRVIPPKVCSKPHTWWRLDDVCQYLDISTKSALYFVDEGVLRARIVRDDARRPYMYLFLLSENKRVLLSPPKVDRR